MFRFTFPVFPTGLLFNFSFPWVRGEVEYGTLYEAFNSNLMGIPDFVLLIVPYFWWASNTVFPLPVITVEEKNMFSSAVMIQIVFKWHSNYSFFSISTF